MFILMIQKAARSRKLLLTHSPLTHKLDIEFETITFDQLNRPITLHSVRTL
jgi:hypothetical protein